MEEKESPRAYEREDQYIGSWRVSFLPSTPRSGVLGQPRREDEGMYTFALVLVAGLPLWGFLIATFVNAIKSAKEDSHG
jgi:hypothetical protein